MKFRETMMRRAAFRMSAACARDIPPNGCPRQLAKLRWRCGIASLGAFAFLYSSHTATADQGAPSAPGLDATMTLTSDYRFRGQSQDGDKAAVQGDFDYTNGAGMFADLWASSTTPGPHDSYEVDPIVGIGRELAPDTWSSLSASYYLFNGTKIGVGGYFEGAFFLSRKIGSVVLTGEATYSPQFADSSGHAESVTWGGEYPLGKLAAGLVFSAHVGYQWLEYPDRYGTPDWLFYDVGLTENWGRVALDLHYTGTNTPQQECFDGSYDCSGSIVISLSLHT